MLARGTAQLIQTLTNRLRLSLPSSPTLPWKQIMPISVGETIPEGTFKYIPYTPELADGVSLFLSNIMDLIDKSDSQQECLWTS